MSPDSIIACAMSTMTAVMAILWRREAMLRRRDADAALGSLRHSYPENGARYPVVRSVTRQPDKADSGDAEDRKDEILLKANLSQLEARRLAILTAQSERGLAALLRPDRVETDARNTGGDV